jgi:hypothetical protein
MWMGLFSYHIASSPSLQFTLQAIPGWAEVLIGHGFPQSWVSGVFASTVATFSQNVPRVGIFIDPLHPPEPDKYGSAPPSIDWYIKCHVPMWYPWSWEHASEARYTDRIARLAPPPHLLQWAATFPTRSLLLPAPDFSSTPAAPTQPTPVTASAAAAPAEEKEWEKFFRYQALRNGDKFRNESDKDRQICEQRELKPPTTNTTVYKWVQSQDDPSKRIRERVSKRWNADTLAEYGTRRRYNSFDNEWDLCSEFSGDDNDGDNDSMFAEDYEYPVEECLVEATLDENSAEEYIQSNPLNRSPSPLLDEPRHDTPESRLALQEASIILNERYGFVPPMVELSIAPGSRKKWKNRRKILGLSEQEVNKASPLDHLEQAMLNFVESLISGQPGVNECDLCDGNWLGLGGLPTFSVAKPNDPSSRVSQIFVLSSRESSSCNWVLGLERAAHLVFAIRSLRPSKRNLHDVARLLIQEGTPFRTLRPLITSSISPSSIMKIIPFRLSGYKFTHEDYTSYIRERSATLSQPRGRAALLRGGILWRIALEHLSIDAALEGPSQAVTEHRVGESFKDMASHCEYWDDCLTDDEANSICGLVNCFTGKSSCFCLPTSLLMPHRTWSAGG